MIMIIIIINLYYYHILLTVSSLFLTNFNLYFVAGMCSDSRWTKSSDDAIYEVNEEVRDNLNKNSLGDGLTNLKGNDKINQKELTRQAELILRNVFTDSMFPYNISCIKLRLNGHNFHADNKTNFYWNSFFTIDEENMTRPARKRSEFEMQQVSNIINRLILFCPLNGDQKHILLGGSVERDNEFKLSDGKNNFKNTSDTPIHSANLNFQLINQKYIRNRKKRRVLNRENHLQFMKGNNLGNRFVTQSNHLRRHGRLNSGNHNLGHGRPHRLLGMLEWVQQPARELLFSNNTGGSLHCSARSDDGGTNVSWAFDDDRPLQPVT